MRLAYVLFCPRIWYNAEWVIFNAEVGFCRDDTLTTES